MKKILFLMMITLAMVGCSSNNSPTPEIPEVPEIPGNPKEYVVSLGFYGEITNIEESPLLRATSNDLYGIQVYSMPVNGSEYKPYAYGLFNSKSGMTIKLLDGYKYKLTSTMYENGISSMKYYGSTQAGGLISQIPNAFTHTTSTLNYVDQGYTWLKLDNGTTFNRPNIDRFYGEISNYVPTENGQVSINMKRVSFGMKIISEGLTEGSLIITLKDAPNITIKYPTIEAQDIFTFNNTYPYGELWSTDNYTEVIPLSISWEKVDGAVIPLVSQDITFKRNKLTTITVKVKDSSTNNGVDITEDKTEMEKGDDIVIESTKQ